MIKSTALPPSEIPPLENGDRLTRQEFERRYNAMPQLKKAELIEGTVQMASALRITKHGDPHTLIIGWLFVYRVATPGVQTGDNCTVILDDRNEPQPDVLLRIEKGGQSIINAEGYVEGAPELLVEIAASSVSIDLHQKLEVYRRHQVQEYMVWRVEDREIDWLRLREDRYVQLQPNSEGIIGSEVFGGLWLDREAMLAENLTKVFEVVQRGLVTTEHQEFVQQLMNKSS